MATESKAIVVQYHACLDEEGGGGVFPVHAIYDSEETWLEHQDCIDYMLDNFGYELGQANMLPKDRYVDDAIEANTSWELGSKEFDPGSVVADMRGEKVNQPPVFEVVK